MPEASTPETPSQPSKIYNSQFELPQDKPYFYLGPGHIEDFVSLGILSPAEAAQAALVQMSESPDPHITNIKIKTNKDSRLKPFYGITSQELLKRMHEVPYSPDGKKAKKPLSFEQFLDNMSGILFVLAAQINSNQLLVTTSVTKLQAYSLENLAGLSTHEMNTKKLALLKNLQLQVQKLDRQMTVATEVLEAVKSQVASWQTAEGEPSTLAAIYQGHLFPGIPVTAQLSSVYQEWSSDINQTTHNLGEMPTPMILELLDDTLKGAEAALVETRRVLAESI